MRRDLGLDPIFVAHKTPPEDYYDDEHRPIKSAVVNAHLVRLVTHSPVHTANKFSSVCYSIEQRVKLQDILDAQSGDLKHHFQSAIKVLRLDAPHIHMNPTKEENHKDWGEQAVCNTDFFQQVGRKVVPRLEEFCVHCDSPKCRGRTALQVEPMLMMLGSGEIDVAE